MPRLSDKPDGMIECETLKMGRRNINRRSSGHHAHERLLSAEVICTSPLNSFGIFASLGGERGNI